MKTGIATLLFTTLALSASSESTGGKTISFFYDTVLIEIIFIFGSIVTECHLSSKQLYFIATLGLKKKSRAPKAPST